MKFMSLCGNCGEPLLVDEGCRKQDDTPLDVGDPLIVRRDPFLRLGIIECSGGWELLDTLRRGLGPDSVCVGRDGCRARFESPSGPVELEAGMFLHRCPRCSRAGNRFGMAVITPSRSVAASPMCRCGTVMERVTPRMLSRGLGVPWVCPSCGTLNSITAEEAGIMRDGSS